MSLGVKTEIYYYPMWLNMVILELGHSADLLEIGVVNITMKPARFELRNESQS